MSLQKFLFNTGVKPSENRYRADYTEIWGTICLAFYVEPVPEGSSFECICENPNLKHDGNVIRRIKDGYRKGAYAYFKNNKLKKGIYNETV